MEKPVKILMCAYAVDNKDVGEAHLTWHWINNIAKHAHVTLITMGSRINDVCGFEDHPNVRLVIAKPKLTFRWTGAFDRVIKPDYIEFFIRARQRAKQLIREERFDAAHHIAPHSPRYPTPLHSLGLKLFVGPIHGGLHMPSLEGGAQERPTKRSFFSWIDAFRKAYDPVMKAHFASATKLLISAPYVRDSLPLQFQAKTLVIPPQPPEVLENPPQRLHSDTLRLVFVGRLIESKGIRLAIKALSYLENNKVTFDVYGQGPMKEELEQLVADCQLESIVRFKGFVTHDEVLKAFYSCDALLFPSLKEAWGLAVSEAMASGLPVICVDRGGPSYMVNEECGLKIPISHEEEMCKAIARAVDQLSADPVRTGRMGVAARERIMNEFTWDRLIAKLLELYKSA